MDIFTEAKHFIENQMVKAIFTFGGPLIASCTVLIILNHVQCLLELSTENKDRESSDAIIYHTINKLFTILKLNEEDQNSRAKDYSDLHKYFVSTLQQYQNNIYDINNLIIEINKGEINETLVPDNNLTDGNDNNTLNNDDEFVIKYIDNFLSTIQDFKEKYDAQSDNEYLNTEILKFIIKDYEETQNLTKSYESDVSDENDFWEESGRRIFKGQRSRIKRFPFMASIEVFNNFHCAGSIIKSDLILTASSCLQLAWNNRFFRENPAFLSARVGSSFYNGGGEVIPVLEIYFHPDYEPRTLRNNICVLRLIRHLKFRRKSKRIKKIDFDRSEHALAVNTPGVTVVGWGAKAHNPVIGNPWENIISYAVLDIYALRECQDVYLKDYVTHKHFCAGFISRGGGACNRDVGGPGIVSGKLMGVISFGSPVCGMPDAPTVFTKVGYYADWIEQIMEQDVPVSQKRTTKKPQRDPFEFPTNTLRPETTTFKIQPFTGKTMTPIPISQIERQLNINDDDLKKVLEIFFDSKELEDYKEIMKVNNKSHNVYQDNAEIEKVADVNEDVTELYEGPEVYTTIDNFSSEHFNMDKENNIVNDNTSERDVSDDEILKLMEKVNLDKIVKEEIANTNMSPGGLAKNESVVTLLYISDDEKKDNIKVVSKEKVNNEDVDDEGMSIALDHFEDLTRSKKHEDYVLPENELYGLLSEMIGEEVQKIKMGAL